MGAGRLKVENSKQEENFLKNEELIDISEIGSLSVINENRIWIANFDLIMTILVSSIQHLTTEIKTDTEHVNCKCYH